MPTKSKENVGIESDKSIDFIKQEFAATIRSRNGSLSEMATLLRFQPGTKGFHRRYTYLLTKAKQLNESFYNAFLAFFGSVLRRNC